MKKELFAPASIRHSPINLQTSIINWRVFTAVVVVTAAVQCLLISITFPVSELFSNTPLFYIDNGFHWYNLKLAVNLFQAGVISGYDPFFAAGTLGGIVEDPSGNVAKMLAILLHPFLSEIQAWKLFVFTAALIGPLAVPIALHWLSLGFRAILIGTGFGLMLWWVSLFHWYHTAGMVSFVLAAFLTLPYLVSIQRLIGASYRTGSLIRVGIAGSALFFLHPLVSIPITLGVLSYLVFNFKDILLRRIVIVITVVPVLVLIPNFIWLIPLLMHTSEAGHWQVTYQANVSVAKIGFELLGIWGGQASGSKLYPVLVLATLTPYFTQRSADYRKQIPFIFLFVALTLYSALGGLSHIIAAFTQPNRFAPVAYLFLIPPAAMALSQLTCDIAIIPRSYSIWLSRGLLGVLTFGLVVVTNEVRREVSYADIGHYGAHPPQVRELGIYSSTVFYWLQSYTHPSARVLFETSRGRIHDRGHMAGYYAYQSQREFIGGPYPYYHFAGYWDGYLFNRTIASLTADDFHIYANLYNIGWVLVHSPASKRFFDNLPSASLLAHFKELALYAVQRPHSFFIQGSGVVTERAHNRLVLDELQPEGDRVVLSYHYFSGMKATPDVTIEPFQNSNDPIPFIAIRNPPKSLTLSIQE